VTKKETAQLAGAVARECIGFRVRLLNRVITNIFDRALQPLGISLAQGNILMLLAIEEQTSPKDIGMVLMMDKSTVSRNLEGLRAKGWIAIASEGEYQPQLVSLTASGRSLIKKAHGAWQKAQKESSQLLGEDGIAAVHALHAKVKKHPPGA
jgi:DNA-binding MarR family transcriptional regulator